MANRATMMSDIERAWLVPIMDSSYPTNTEEASSNPDTSGREKKEFIRPHNLTEEQTSAELRRLRINVLRTSSLDSQTPGELSLMIRQTVVGLAHLAINSAQENDLAQNTIQIQEKYIQNLRQRVEQLEFKNTELLKTR